MTDQRSHRASALDIFVLLTLVITFLLRYAAFLTSRLLFGPFLDNVHIYGPIFSGVSRLALTGSVPYYLPDIGTGFPVFESPHFSILYPLYFFGLLNYGGPLASLYTLTNLTLLHLFIFYVNLYVLLRCATVPPWAAYVGASVGMLAWNTQLYASWITVTASYAWLPLVLAGGGLLLRFPGKKCGILVFSIAAALLALASASQSVIHATVAVLMLLTIGAVWLCFQRRFADLRRVALSLVVCGGIAFGLAGVAVLPMYIATGQMIRHIGAGAAVVGYAPLPWEHFNLHQLTLDQITGILIRPTWINIIGSPYVGPLGLIGVLLAAIYFRHLATFPRMLAVAFGVISLYGLLSAFGTHLGLAYINFRLPLIDKVREAGRHLVLFVIGVSFLSGLGYSLLARRFQQYKQSDRARLFILPATLFLIFCGIILWELLQPRPASVPRGFWIMWLVPILFAVGYVCRLSDYNNMVFSAVTVSIAAVVVPIRAFTVAQSTFNKPMNLLSHRVLQRMAPDVDAANYRVDFRDKAFSNRFWAMNASYYGIKSFYNQLTPQPYDQFQFSNFSDVPNLREMMGARYVLCGPADSPTDAGAKQILETEGYRLYENPGPMGRLTLVHRVAGPINNQNEFLQVLGKGFNFLSEAYVTPGDFKKVDAFLRDSQPPRSNQEHISRIVDRPNRSYSTVQSNSASLLVLNEWFTPAWKARVNGRKQPVLRVNQWQTAVLLPAGKNRVEFEYRPTFFRILMVLNRITILLLLLFVLLELLRRHRLGLVRARPA